MAAPKMPPSPFSDYPAFLRQSMKRVVGNPAQDREAAEVALSQQAAANASRRKQAWEEAERKFKLAMDPNSKLPPDVRKAYLNERNLLLAGSGGFKADWGFIPQRLNSEQ